MTGPVQVLVVGFDNPTFSGEVLNEFTRLRQAGIVRLIDLLIVSRTEDGTLETLEAPEATAADLGGLAAGVLGQPEDASPVQTDAADLDVAVWSLADAIPVGGTAAVALIEHVWADPLSAVIQRAGGTLLEETWLARPEVELLDIPILRDGDNTPGFYAAFGATGTWSGAELAKSSDDVTYERVLTASDLAVMGVTTTVLGTWAGGNVFDEDVSAGDESDKYLGDGFLSSKEDGFHIGTKSGEWFHAAVPGTR